MDKTQGQSREPSVTRGNGPELVSNGSMSSYRFRVCVSRQANNKDDERDWNGGNTRQRTERSALRLEEERSAGHLSDAAAGTRVSGAERTPRVPSAGSALGMKPLESHAV